MPSEIKGSERPLLVVIPASSGPGAAVSTPEYLRPIMGRPQIEYVLDAAGALVPDEIIVFVHGAEEETTGTIAELIPPGASVVSSTDDPSDFAADMFSRLRNHPGDVLFIPATIAPLDGDFLGEFIEECRRRPGSPCRVEAVGADGGKRTGLLLAGASKLAEIKETPDDREKTFTDRVFDLLDRYFCGNGVRDFVSRRPRCLGDISSPRNFAAGSRAIRIATAERLMDGGVTIIDPDRIYIDWGVRVGSGTTLYPDTYLEGATTVGEGCIIGPNVKITDSTVEGAVTIKMCSVISESVIEGGVQIGPFAHVRPKTRLCRNVRIGNFVEIKKSTIGEGSKASHLSYIGDARIGKEVNVGAGTITCNYDGVNKHTTEIGDGVFIGSDSQFVAPVTVGDNSLIGAGSTITKDVPPDTLAVARSKQINIPDRGFKSRKERK